MNMDMLTADNMKHILPSPHRTQGDGMENVTEVQAKMETMAIASPKPIKKSLIDDFLYRPTDVSQRSFPPPVILGKMVNLMPKNVSQLKKEKLSYAGFKTKEPKFIPYEPYKAAVNPIMPVHKHKAARIRRTSNTSAIESVTTATAVAEGGHVQMPEASADPEKDGKLLVACRDEVVGADTSEEWEEEQRVMEGEIRQLKEENSQLETQLKFQAQVNGELKKLLVAAVGEDLETRVNHLTEDKVQLARALLSSAQRLSTHQEQTEWLAGQCEVWRSKFLASSLMVEELARWKAALSQKAMDLQDALQRLLDERCKLRCSQLDIHRKLSVLRENFDSVSAVSGLSNSSRRNLPSSSALDLTLASQRLCEVLTVQLLGSAMDHHAKPILPNYQSMDQHTPAEKNAVNLLQQPVSALLAGGPDTACSAVMALAGSQLFPRTSSFACCAHCSGEVKQL